ncbi:hypothetical protein JCM9533A_83570 [Catenuloplanes niger JCM 9533]
MGVRRIAGTGPRTLTVGVRCGQSGRMELGGSGERCVVDPGRPCGACSAPGPELCPYRYLLDDDELRAVHRSDPPAAPMPAASMPAAPVPPAAVLAAAGR